MGRIRPPDPPDSGCPYFACTQRTEEAQAQDAALKLTATENDTLHSRSGHVETQDLLVAFLYDVLRDHLPAGVVEKLMRDQTDYARNRPYVFTNGYLARYAQDLATRLMPGWRREDAIVRCGVAVVLHGVGEHDGKVLMGERAGSHGAGTWSFPGGWMEFGESFHDAAQRELLEETTLVLEGARQRDAIETCFRDAGRHSVTILLEARGWSGTPQVPPEERHKLRGEWTWVPLEKVGQLRLFEPLLRSRWLMDDVLKIG